MPRWSPHPNVGEITNFDPELFMTKRGRGEGRHTSNVLQQAYADLKKGIYATCKEAAEAHYELYSGRRVSNERNEKDICRRKNTIKRMSKKIKTMIEYNAE